MTSVGGDSFNTEAWRKPSSARQGPRAAPRPGPQVLNTRMGHGKQSSWSTAGMGHVDGGKGKARETAMEQMLGGPTGKRTSKYPLMTVEHHPSTQRDPEVEYYPEAKEYTEFDRDWEGQYGPATSESGDYVTDPRSPSPLTFSHSEDTQLASPVGISSSLSFILSIAGR